MPGDLSNPDFLFPFYYDQRYDPGTNPVDSRPQHLNSTIQSIAQSVLGRPLSKEDLKTVFDHVDTQKLLQRNPGDPELLKCVEVFLKKLTSAKKVAKKWQI
jgi:hypothetical protein